MPKHQYDDTSDFIAVIGMSGRFPGADNLEEFWSNIDTGTESVSFFSREELLESGISPEVIDDPNYIPAKGVLKDAECFDADFFGYSPRESKWIDPQQRLFLESCYHALEDSGACPPATNNVGVFATSSFNTYLLHHVSKNPSLLENTIYHQILTSNSNDFLATRVAYKLNLKGPALTLQTACSSSLVAIHEACQSLLSYQCDMALAGGVCLTFPMMEGYPYMKEFIASSDGHCRPFDKKSSGTVAGNGVGVVVLKRLEEALEDDDHIYAVVRGSAINNDGQEKVGYTAPSVQGQSEAILSAHSVAEISPDTIEYVETHGTGTLLGDPIEVQGLQEAFSSQSSGKQHCALGSLKANIGHLDVAAGVAGFIKTALCLYHKTLPPLANYESPNPNIAFEETPFYINKKSKSWDSSEHPRRAGVSSFGIGGTNAHIILEEALVEQSPIQRHLTEFKRTQFSLSAPVEASQSSPTKAPLTYSASWEKTPFTPTAKAELPESNVWLLFGNGSKACLSLQESLKEKHQPFILVRKGSSFEESSSHYEVCPESLQDFVHLFDSLNERELLCSRVFFLWSTSEKFSHTTAEVSSNIENYEALLHIARSWSQTQNSEVRISIVADAHGIQGSSPRFILNEPLIIGAYRTIPLEFKQIYCELLGVTASGSMEMLPSLLAEPLAEDDRILETTTLWKRSFLPQPEKASNLEPFILKDGGVYLITGGLGGVGLTLADYITSKVSCTLILLSRRGSTEYSVLFETIQNSSSRIEVVPADAGSSEEMENLFKALLSEYGHINGVIHAAGIPAEGLIINKTHEEIEEGLSAKVKGSHILKSFMEQTPLDFLIFCSSISSLTGIPGQSDYTAANAYLDAMADLYSPQYPVVSVIWDTWTDIGMAERAKSIFGVASKSIGPLVDSCLLNTSETKIYESYLEASQEWVLYDHIVNGAPVLPGTGFVEMLAELFKSQLLHGESLCIQKLDFISPLSADLNTSTAVRLEINSSGKGKNFRLISLTDNSWRLHSTAQVSTVSRKAGAAISFEGKVLSEAENIDNIHDLLSEHERSDFLIVFGDYWSNVQARNIQTSGNLMRGEFYVPDEIWEPEMLFHPALMDIAIGSVKLLSIKTGVLSLEEQEAYLPLSYQEILLHAPIPQQIVLIAKELPSSTASCLKFDLQIFDEKNTLLAEITEFAMKRLNFDKLNVSKAISLSQHKEIYSPSVHFLKGLSSHNARVAFGQVLENLQTANTVITRRSPEQLRQIIQQLFMPQKVYAPQPEEATKAEPVVLQEAPQQRLPEQSFSREAIEAILSGLLEELLDVESLSPDSDFRELGIDSFTMVTLKQEIETEVGIDISLEDLTKHSSINALTEYISEALPEVSSAPSISNEFSKTLIKLRTGASNVSPLFCIHPAGGSITLFQSLCSHLSSSLPIYGLQATPEEGLNTSISKMAAYYIEAIQSVQPTGPYYFCGASMGGTVCFEMAQQLQQKGETVQLLAMLDTPSLPKKSVSEIKDLESQSIIKFVSNLSEDIYKDLQALDQQQKGTLDQFLELWKEHQVALTEYEKRPYTGKVLYFAASLNEAAKEFIPPHPEYAWIPFARHGIEIHEVPANHLTMYLSPHAENIASIIEEHLPQY